MVIVVVELLLVAVEAGDAREHTYPDVALSVLHDASDVFIADALFLAIYLKQRRLFRIRNIHQSAVGGRPDATFLVLDKLVHGVGRELRLFAQMRHEFPVPVENVDAPCQGAYPQLAVIILYDGERYRRFAHDAVDGILPGFHIIIYGIYASLGACPNLSAFLYIEGVHVQIPGTVESGKGSRSRVEHQHAIIRSAEPDVAMRVFAEEIDRR